MIDRLVERSERIMGAELTGWVQEMQDAMTQFRLDQSADRPANGSARRHARSRPGSHRR